ncbi:MAG: hypothetical protein OK441_04845, partial [Thaumarchaeota archaeon]|nr:hypothetical protein [Nitrososphaerota archaeon]
TQSQLAVASEDLSGGSITGYYAVLYQGGNPVSNGYTPVTFSFGDGQSYVVQVDNYGSCAFDHWADTGSTNPQRSISIEGNAQITAVYNCGESGGSSSMTLYSVNQGGSSVSGFYVALLEGGNVVATGFTPTTFSTVSGASYGVLVDGYGNCSFSNWSDGARGNPRSFAANGTQSLTAVFDCGGGTPEGGAGPGTITVYDHRIPAPYWTPCFATACTNPQASCEMSCTGPGAAMWVVLYDANGNVVATGFSNENGLTFSGLNPSATYYVYPADCDQCHGSTHDVLFAYWGDNTTSTRPLAVVANGTFVDAWFKCTNGCSGG